MNAMRTLGQLGLAAIAWDFLGRVKGKMSADLQKLIDNRAVYLKDATVFIRKNITGEGSNFDLIDATTEAVKGVSTFKGLNLPKNEGFIITQIAIGYAETTGAGKEASVKYGSTDIAALANANLVISQGNREVVNLPVKDLIRPAGTDTNAKDQYYELSSLEYLVDDDPMTWQIVFPQGVTMPAPVVANDDQYIEVFVKGFKTIKNVR